jgi:putative heme-binding domain-containing protein
VLRPLAAPTLLLVLLTILAIPAGARAQARSEPADVQAGGELYNSSCRICHGEAGVGHRAPTLRSSRLTLDYATRIIAAGKPGTMMPSFQNAFKPEQIRQLSLYLMSLQRPDSPWAALRGHAEAGQRVFFDAAQSHSCHGCHSFKGEGGRVGPDLTAKLKGKAPVEIFQKIVIVPHRSADPAYVNVGLVMKSGEKLTGIKAEETPTEMRFYDTSVLPPKVLTLAKADIASTTRLNGSAMPSDYASRLPLQQLLDLVAFLKSGADGKDVTVTFADVINERSTRRR